MFAIIAISKKRDFKCGMVFAISGDVRLGLFLFLWVGVCSVLVGIVGVDINVGWFR